MDKKTMIEIEYKGEKIKGPLLNEDNDYFMIKLDSGYNANLKKSECKVISKKEIENKSSKTKSAKKENNKLPKIAILHTGGTIASKVDYKTGAVSSQFTADELLDLFPELNKIANLKPQMIGNLSSEDMNFNHWNLLLDAINKSIEEGAQGVIISHGTDTMHYTASALNYATQNLSVPVILVGAQRSSDRASSDAFTNLKATINFIIDNSKKSQSYNRVGICMHSSISKDEFYILDGINAKKMHSSRRDAFKQINYLPFAQIKNDKIKVLRSVLETSKPENKLKTTKFDIKLKIGFFKAHPNLIAQEIKNLSFYDGVVIEGTGLGHLAVSEFDKYTKDNVKNLEAIKKLIKTTKLVVGIQTVYGQTNMNIYSSGKALLQTGVLGDYMNLTTETLFTRMAYCLSCKKKFEDVWSENLEGFEERNIEIDEK